MESLHSGLRNRGRCKKKQRAKIKTKENKTKETNNGIGFN
jgi:hypothetical protein